MLIRSIQWMGATAVLATSLAVGLIVSSGRAADAPPADAATDPHSAHVAQPADASLSPAGDAPSPAAAAAANHAMDERSAIIARFFSAHCVACHGTEKQKGDVALHTFLDRPTVLGGRKTVQHALELVKAGEMPPEGKPQPAMAEVDTFAAAVNGFYAAADSVAGVNPGRVTVRRLNRTEYNNTVRDLLGVDSNPAGDFPNDDIGHGFDNIGDVLTISPILMDRYLTAAESIAKAAILTDPPKLSVRKQAANRMKPSGPKVGALKYRPLTRGDLQTEIRVSIGGQYSLSAKVYARPADDGTPVVARLLLDGQPIGSTPVTATSSQSAQEVSAKFQLLDAGDYRFGIEIANPSDGVEALDIGTGSRRASADAEPLVLPEHARLLYVQGIALTPPADTMPPSQRKILGWANPEASQADRTRQIVTRLATLAYRRPASKDEIDRLSDLVDHFCDDGGQWEAGLQLAIQAILSSPKFLFRLELDDEPGATKPRPLGDYAMASRLSYFLWSSMPDDELFALAEKGELSKQLEPQVRRMLKDPRARALVDNFAMQWLQLKRLKTFVPDKELFPKFDDRVRDAMGKETQLFIGEVVREDRPITDLLDAPYTYLNGRLARVYGIVDRNGNTSYEHPEGPRGERFPRDDDEFVRVTLPKDSMRGGLLTQASILTVTSNPTRTSPVKRGRWVLEQILGAPPPPPPPNVPELKESGAAVAEASLRQRMEAHRANPACANCHAKMDPIGFAFEHFDAIGAFRDKDGKFAIDASGVLPDGSKFDGPGELRGMLIDKRKDQFTHCLAEKMLIYAIGRGLEYYDAPTVTQISQKTIAGDYRFSRLVTEIVESAPFRLRAAAEGEQASVATP